MRAARSTEPAYLVVGINWKSPSSGHASTAILRPRHRSGRSWCGKDVTTNWGRPTATCSGVG